MLRCTLSVAMALSILPVGASAACLDDLFANYADQQQKVLSLAALKRMQLDPSYQACAESTRLGSSMVREVSRKLPKQSEKGKSGNSEKIAVRPIPPETIT